MTFLVQQPWRCAAQIFQQRTFHAEYNQLTTSTSVPLVAIVACKHGAGFSWAALANA